MKKGFNEFSAITELLQKNLDENGSYLLNGIGTFTKDKTGVIRFAPVLVDPLFTPPIPAVKLGRQEHSSHPLLVGDQHTTNVEMTEYFNLRPPLKNPWWIQAIILAAIGISILLFYCYRHGINGFGNVNYFN